MPTIDVITDGSFIDTAVFILAVIDASKVSPAATIRVRQVDWASVPYEVAKATNAIAYMNRRSIPDVAGGVQLWSNLCSFHGYALMGRPADFPTAPADLASANSALEKLAYGRRLKIITFGSDSVDVLRTPLTPIFDSDRVTIESLPVEHALDRFMNGRGDLFIGGLPQRLICVQNGLVEVLTSQINPLMLGIDALVYKGEVALPILEAISTSWSRMSRRLAANEHYCRGVHQNWTEIARILDIRPTFGEREFLVATHSKAGSYLKFFAGRDDAATDLIQATETIVEQARHMGMSREQVWSILRALHEVYVGTNADRDR